MSLGSWKVKPLFFPPAEWETPYTCLPWLSSTCRIYCLCQTSVQAEWDQLDRLNLVNSCLVKCPDYLSISNKSIRRMEAAVCWWFLLDSSEQPVIKILFAHCFCLCHHFTLTADSYACYDNLHQRIYICKQNLCPRVKGHQNQHQLIERIGITQNNISA